jgi:hypothetical protein
MKSFTQHLSRALAVALLLVTSTASSQLSSMGRDFYLAQASSNLNCASVSPFQSYWLLVSSPYDCNVSVAYFDHWTGQEFQEHTYHILAKNFVQIPINTGYTVVHDPLTGNNANINGEVAEYTAIHVHADRPISVSYFSSGPDNGSMYLALPTPVLGKNYVVAAASNDDGTGRATTQTQYCSNNVDPSSSFFTVIAIKDGTHVTILPSGTTRKGTPGVTSGPNNGHGVPTAISVALNRGQVYVVKSDIKSQPAAGTIDMTGSQIESDQPIAVISGCENAYNGTGSDSQDDQRNLSCQMMVPTDYWASKDYIAIPLFDSPGLSPNDNSAGDQLKIVVADPLSCQVKHNFSSNFNTYQPTPYQFPATAINNVQEGTTFQTDCGEKFFVEQYDYRAKGTTYPLTAPCQMNVVPLQNFAHSFMWSMPDESTQKNVHQYVTVICQSFQLGKIKVFKNGKPIGTMDKIGTACGTVSIPHLPQYNGYRFEVGTGSYYASGDSAFVVYQYGMADYIFRSNSPFSGADYFHQYASPAGQTFHIDGAGSPSMSIDTVCEGRPFWMVHARDTAATDHFLSTIEILKDPLGVYKRRPNSDTGFTSYNVEFEPTNFTLVPGLDTKVDVKVVIQNPLQKAEAWVWTVNGAGNDTLVHLVYIAPQMKFGAVTSSGVDANGDAVLNFENAKSGVDTCSQFVFKNVGVAAAGTFHLTNVRFQLGGQGFTVSSITPPLPASLGAGDSVVIHVCFNTTRAGKVLLDTLIAETECPTAFGFLSGSTNLPEIVANDYDFGAVVVGDTECHTIRISNIGKAPFTLTTGLIISNFGNADFRFTDMSKLPYVLQPNAFIDLNFCYTPSDTARDSSVVTWATDISDAYKTNKKNYSVLKGFGIRPAVSWDRDAAWVQTPCNIPRTFRTWLFNHGTAMDYIDTIVIKGKTKSAWKISDVQGGRIHNIILGQDHLPDSMWVDITYTPDTSFGCMAFDSLIALDQEGISAVEVLVGGEHLGVDAHSAISNVTISPNPLENALTVFISLQYPGSVDVEILDILGNRLTSLPQQRLATGASEIPIDAHAWPAGVYFVRVTTESGTVTKRVVKTR